MKKILSLLIIPLLLGCKQVPAQKNVDAKAEGKQELTGAAKYFAEMEAKALSIPFRGIETEKGKELELFPLKSTGVSTAPIQKAAASFLSSLTTVQKEKTQFAIDDDEWRKWCNVDNGIYERQGISLKAMTNIQKEAAFGLMRVSLSAKGLQLSKNIMKTDQTLKELNNGDAAYDEELYFFTLMGTPSSTEPWGWQLDGHHLVINYFVLGDQVVMSPVFMGGEPIITTSGKYNGNTLFQDEQNLGLHFMQSLSKEQQTEAIISSSKHNNDIKAEASKDNVTLNYEGLKVSKLAEEQKERLVHLISQYINNMKEGHHQVKMEEIMHHWNRTYFAWVGETTPDAVFYYRIHSPVVLIEFDHQAAIGVPNSPKGPIRNHIHTILRTPNGNDYGKDLLRQHLEKSHHH
ncbi:MAG: DUF3500 domain-containing protein [Maribacter sp.]|uniref:DUF3500 domain-containing protein n=1 Tax=Maribacter sp. TaxID=1897614 RepID=UPI0032976331